MKHLITLLTLVITFLMITYLNEQQDEFETFVISLNKYHYVVARTKETIEIPLFISNDHHPLLKVENLDRIRLINDDVNMDVWCDDIVWSHVETFQEITYQVYYVILAIPTIDYSLLMEDVTMRIEHIDGLYYEVSIGYVEFFTYIQPFDASWSDIHAKRYENTLSIESIHATSDVIDAMYVSQHIETTLSYLNQSYLLTIENKSVLFWDVPVCIEKNGYVEMVIGVKWIASKRILTQTEDYHVSYIWYGSQSRQTL